MQRRLLTIWHIGLIILAVELVVYLLVSFGTTRARNTVWENLNEKVYVIEEVNNEVLYRESINRYARQVGINGNIIASVIQAESSFQPRARSSAGAYGLMQITPGTWRHVNQQAKVCENRHLGDCTIECYYNEELNISIGTLYLRQLLDQYKGNLVLALAAYNAGPGTVNKYGGIPPYDETINYVNRVIGYWYKFSSNPMPNTIFTAEQWELIRTVLGWWCMVTLLGILWIAGKLYRYYHSWRWR